MLLACAAFTAMQAVVKLGRESGFSAAEVMFLRTAPGLPLLWIILRRRGQGLRPDSPRSLVVRSLFGSVAMGTNFTAMRSLTLAQFSILGLSQPVFVALAAPLLLNERARAHTWLAMLLSFSGALVLLDPGSAVQRAPLVPAALGLCSALASAFAHIWVRKATETDPPERVVFYFAACVSVGSLATALASGELLAASQSMSGERFAALVLALSGFGTLGQVLMTRAYLHGEAAIVSIVGYAGVAMSMLLDLAIWQVAPAANALLGALLMLGAGVLLYRGERVRS
jgi:drug/metabolite transporter (DMT)-like permease